MSNVQFQSFSNKSNSKRTKLKENDDFISPIANSIVTSMSSEEAHNNKSMNYDTTPTPTYKPLTATSETISAHKNAYYQQLGTTNNDTWVVGNTTSVDNNTNNRSTTTTETSLNPSATNEDELQQRHLQQLFDKKRRRRESHNAVERRRRDNINERIFELSTLLPERNATKDHKGNILRKSVDHIRLLHDKVNQYQQRIQELESLLEMYRMRWGDLNHNSVNNTSGVQQQQQAQHFK